MTITLKKETQSYNQNRYSKEWIAKVTFTNDGTANFSFGKFVGNDGDAGLLIIELNPDDIYARGQKDYRNPKNSAPRYYVLKSEEESESLKTKADAYKYFIKNSGDLT